MAYEARLGFTDVLRPYTQKDGLPPNTYKCSNVKQMSSERMFDFWEKNKW